MAAPESPRPASLPIHEVEVQTDVGIVARDGVRLSANLWLPAGAAGSGSGAAGSDSGADARFPAILEMIPYGKDSWRWNADQARGEFLARRGYVLCRLDVRGTGTSEGIATDEYSDDETADGVEAVEWLAAQPWSNGRVGMWGISYGGFTAIQVAARRPPHLAAIAPTYATDDRYTDDVHYLGGCVTVSELSQYAVSQVAMNAMPPEPSRFDDDLARWRRAWLERLDRTPPWLLGWLREQADGPFWRRGSLAPDHRAIDVPILQLAGWMDSYVDAALRMQARCTAPRRVIVGNWVHSWPSDAYPGPNLDWLHETLRFFDAHLKGVDNGAMAEPAVTWFEREFATPEPFPEAWPGRWRATSAVPHPAAVEQSWALQADRDGAAGGGRMRPPSANRPVPAATSARISIPHRATAGTRGPLSWGAGGAPNGLARDLRPDEALGATFTSAPLPEPLAIFGTPVAALTVSASMAVATIVVRLSDVAPDGTSAQVSAGVLNLTHRRSHAEPEPLEPGRAESVQIGLRATGYRFLAGHRVRLSVLTQLWPVTWPSPFPGELTLHLDEGAAALRLPIVPAAGGPGDLPVPAFETSPPELAEGGSWQGDPPAWRIVEDVLAGSVTVETHDGGEETLRDGRRLYSAESLRMTARDADPASARLEADVLYRWRTPAFEAEIRATSRQTSDAEAFTLVVDLAVDLDGAGFFARRWEERIPRRLV